MNTDIAEFAQTQQLMKTLLAPGNKILVEAGPFDKIWGIGLAEDRKDATDVVKWQGTNLLGVALMEVRDMLRSDVL